MHNYNHTKLWGTNDISLMYSFKGSCGESLSQDYEQLPTKPINNLEKSIIMGSNSCCLLFDLDLSINNWDVCDARL